MRPFESKGIICGILAGWLLVGCQYSPEEPFVDIYDTEHVKEISGWRILHIDKENKTAALNILGNQAAIALSELQLAAIFTKQIIDPSVFLNNDIDESIKDAEKFESNLKSPYFANDLDMKKEAEEHRANAKYLSGLHGKIMPYLIKAKLCSKDKNAGFRAAIDLRTGYLLIEQGCLSNRDIFPWVEPVVVFSEVPVKKVKATIVVDE